MVRISHLKKSDVNLLKDRAIELGCNSAYLEKDYYIVQLIRRLQELSIDEGELLFTGGTSLSKAYNVIHRFSEDCDYLLVGNKLTRKKLSNIKKLISEHLTSYGFDISHTDAKNENKNITFFIKYESSSKSVPELRKELKLEIIYKNSDEYIITHQDVRSFLAESKRENPEVHAVKCLAVEEISAGKLSALTWRILEGNGKKELIRHLYDLASLADKLISSRIFKEKVIRVIDHDLRVRGKSSLTVKEAGKQLLTRLKENSLYKEDYREYLENFIYTNGINKKHTFDEALLNLSKIIESL